MRHIRLIKPKSKVSESTLMSLREKKMEILRENFSRNAKLDILAACLKTLYRTTSATIRGLHLRKEGHPPELSTLAMIRGWLGISESIK